MVIVDRDGVINEDRDDYIKSAEEWVAIPGSLEAIAKLSQSGYTVVIATNQSGIGRGLFDLDTLETIHKKLTCAVESHGGSIAGIYYCPHRPDDNCACRKPRTGLLDRIESDFKLSVAGMPFIGDSLGDLLAAIQKQCRPILVKTGKGKQALHQIGNISTEIAVFKNLADAAEAIISH